MIKQELKKNLSLISLLQIYIIDFIENLEKIKKITLIFYQMILSRISNFNGQKIAKGLYNRSLFVNKINLIPIQNKESFDARND